MARALEGVEHPRAMWRGLGLLGGADDLVDLPRRDAGLVGIDRRAERRVQAGDALARERRDRQHRRVTDEVQSGADLVVEVDAALGVGQVPLVEQHDHRATGRVDALGEALVLRGDTLGGVDDEDGDVGGVDGLQGSDDRVVLGAVLDLGASSHARGVDEADGAGLGLDDGVDGVARGSGHVVDDRVLAAGQPVEQRGLPHVGSTDDGHRDLVGVALVDVVVDHLVLGDGGEQGVEQVGRAAAVEGRQAIRGAQTQFEEVPDHVLASRIIDLVDDQEHLLVLPAENGCGLGILLGDPRGPVDDEHDEVAVLHGRLGLAGDLGVEFGTPRHPTAGVDDVEGSPEPVHLDDLAVTGHAGALFDDGGAATGEAVDQGGLADVRPADDGHGGAGHEFLERWVWGAAGRRSPMAWRSAAPSVGTTSTVLGRSRTVMPSRNVSSERQTSGSR